ncbi:hypothetical protein AVEN_41388-1 [Araneus ventricosus]|uniref:Uncharacterized protein n=1 Tax=Araneus ventricosus TaxID=182803 RepID=A0A4Y2SMH7_ARAVE|nr:hypothetical protein AVEN_41388-1 [Araneus ventricosus]
MSPPTKQRHTANQPPLRPSHYRVTLSRHHQRLFVAEQLPLPQWCPRPPTTPPVRHIVGNSARPETPYQCPPQLSSVHRLCLRTTENCYVVVQEASRIRHTVLHKKVYAASESRRMEVVSKAFDQRTAAWRLVAWCRGRNTA